MFYLTKNSRNSDPVLEKCVKYKRKAKWFLDAITQVINKNVIELKKQILESSNHHHANVCNTCAFSAYYDYLKLPIFQHED